MELRGTRPLSLVLSSTGCVDVDLAVLAAGRLVVYTYPGKVCLPTEQGRGAEPDAVQHQAFARGRDDFSGLRCRVVGLSTQSSAAQAREVAAHGLEHELLSDPGLLLTDESGLPTFMLGSRRLYERLVLLVTEDCVEEVFCPAIVAPTGVQVTAWWRSHQ